MVYLELKDVRFLFVFFQNFLFQQYTSSCDTRYRTHVLDDDETLFLPLKENIGNTPGTPQAPSHIGPGQPSEANANTSRHDSSATPPSPSCRGSTPLGTDNGGVTGQSDTGSFNAGRGLLGSSVSLEEGLGAQQTGSGGENCGANAGESGQSLDYKVRNQQRLFNKQNTGRMQR